MICTGVYQDLDTSLLRPQLGVSAPTYPNPLCKNPCNNKVRKAKQLYLTRAALLK